MSTGFKGFLLFHCLKIEACSENAQTISGAEVHVSSWIFFPLQHAEHLKSKNRGNSYGLQKKAFT